MDKNRMSEIYLRLHRLLDIDLSQFTGDELQNVAVTDSDIIMGAEMGSVLREIKPEQREESLSDLVQMQLAADELVSFVNQDDFQKFLSLPKKEQTRRCIEYLLDYNIDPYPEKEKKAILFNMLNCARNLKEIKHENENDEYDLQMIRISRQTCDELRQEVINEIMEIAPRLAAEGAPRLNDEIQENAQADSNHIFSVGSGSCAAYAASDKLRCFPETIGMMTAAVPEIEKKQEHQQDECLRLLVMAVASSLVCNFIFGSAIGMGVTMGAGAHWIKEVYQDFISALSVDLKFAPKITGVKTKNNQAEQSVNTQAWETDEDEESDEEIEEEENENNEYLRG